MTADIVVKRPISFRVTLNTQRMALMGMRSMLIMAPMTHLILGDASESLVKDSHVILSFSQKAKNLKRNVEILRRSTPQNDIS